MPIIVDPSEEPPEPPVEVVSPDGVLTVRRDDSWAGVYLVADFSDLDPDPMKVRFTRVGADGVEMPVRSGDTAWAPGGIAIAYDHEAPLGQSSTWYAYPIGWDGEVGERSDGAAVTPPEPSEPRDTWLKAVGAPEMSQRVWVRAWPTLEYEERQQRFDVLGAAPPVMRVDAWSTPTATAVLETDTLQGRLDLLALLTSGTTLLAQTHAEYGRPDTFWTPGKITEEMGTHASDPHRTWTVALTAVARPSTIGAPLRIPDRSYGDSSLTWPTYADRTATGQTYADVTTGG